MNDNVTNIQPDRQAWYMGKRRLLANGGKLARVFVDIDGEELWFKGEGKGQKAWPYVAVGVQYTLPGGGQVGQYRVAAIHEPEGTDNPRHPKAAQWSAEERAALDERDAERQQKALAETQSMAWEEAMRPLVLAYNNMTPRQRRAFKIRVLERLEGRAGCI